ncbi:hypothetical protein [Legionella yabuuchiae]|uniref:hypothetical protein n=1 Tax=Legionella yabuuchiae TaxID=376727 RepID=UPI0010543105|nr:hypothetical protein [Legionella yabuuchiae]
MKKNYLRSTIIVTAQTIFPTLVLLIIGPWLLSQGSTLASWDSYLSKIKYTLFIMHGLFYFTFILLWPRLVTALKTQETTPRQIQLATQARWYLLCIFLLIDLITCIGVNE